MKKLIALLCVLTMIFCLVACSSSTEEAADDAASEESVSEESTEATTEETADDTTEEAGDASYVVGICQYVTHDSLDASTLGFKDALTEAFGDSVAFVENNAGGEYTNCATIADGLVTENVDLILANATPALQACASATADIPILGTSVTDYATALSITDWTGTVGGNISGTSDLAPLDEQAAMLQELFPDAENVGLLYCSGEPNSVYQVETISAALKDMGYSVDFYAFTDVNDLASVTQTACDNCDVLYIPTDNTAVANTEAIANVVLPAGVPVVCGEISGCTGCGVATLSIDYYELGYITGQMAVKILNGEADISTMPIETAPAGTKMYQPVNCEELNITIPDDYEAIVIE